DTIPVVGYAFPRRAWERGSWWVLRQPPARERRRVNLLRQPRRQESISKVESIPSSGSPPSRG
nr:hypothetical protein [Endozoicomonas sp.]